MINGISVIMPIYNQAYFIRRAVISLLRQSYQNWELIIINDGSTDCVESMIHDFLKHPQIKYTYNKKNTGLGHALNQGISNARYDYIAYLPADDYYYANHLKELKSIIENNMDCVLAFSGIKYQESNSLIPTHDTQSLTLRNNYCLQLVQVVHKKTEDRWMERAELVTDDLFIMFWKKLADKGSFMPTFHTTCYWTQHPLQRHKICSESYGGNIYRYKFHYRIEEAIRIRMSKYKTIDEYESYTYLKRNNSFASSKSMKILIVGALSYNPERICALEEQGCELYGLWKPYPRFGFESAGKLAFGNCIDVPFENYAQKVKEINPDIIYGVASSMSVGFVNEIFTTLKHNGIQAPLIWHFKEGPQICIGNGTWEDFIQNYLISDGNIFLNLLTKEWIEQFIPSNDKPSMILDQDPPKIDCFNGHFSTKLSSHDGEIHTVVAGRMIGIKPEELQLLAQNQIHIHLYSESYHSEKEKQYNQCKQIAPNHFHIHKQCSTDKWVEEFSKYDAGWLHCFDSENEGDILRLSWDDLNIPARMGVLAAAGIPMIQKDNTGNKVATQEILEEKGVGILFQNIADLVTKLHDRSYMEERNKNIKKNRAYFAFDSHLPELIAFFKEVIKKKKENGNK